MIDRTPGVRRLQKAGLLTLAVLFVGLAWYGSSRAIDFQVYHRIATQILHGDYELYPRAVYDGTTQGDTHEFQYAPVVAFLFVPFGLLSLQVAAFVFACLKILAYASMTWVIARRANAESRYGWLLFASLLVVGGYLVEEFRNGNVHALIVLLLVLAFDLAERGKVAAPAAAIGLAIATKLTPVMLLAYFALRRRYAMCAATIGVLVVLWALPAAVVGVRMNNHLTEGFVRSTARMVNESDNYSLRGALLRTFTSRPVVNPRYPPTNVTDMPEAVVVVLWLALVGVIVVTMVVVLWRPPADSMSALVEFALLLTAMLVVAPHTQRMHFSTLFVPAAVLLAFLVRSPASRDAPLVRGALIVNAAAATFLPLVFGSRTLSLAYQAFSPYTLGAIALLVVLLVLTRTLKRALYTPGSRARSSVFTTP